MKSRPSKQKQQEVKFIDSRFHPVIRQPQALYSTFGMNMQTEENIKSEKFQKMKKKTA